MTGTVREWEGGPRPDVTVFLSAVRGVYRDQLHAKPDSAGRFRFEGVPAGPFRLRVSNREIRWPREPGTDLVVPTSGEVEQDVVVGVPVLSGTVRVAGTGDPIPDLDVVIGRISTAWNVGTDENGEWRALDLPPGDYDLWFRKAGFVPSPREKLALREGETRRIDAELERAAVVDLVLRGPDGEPVTGEVTVTFRRAGDGEDRGMGGRTAADGRIRYSEVRPGEYEISVSAPEAGRGTVRATLAAGEPNRVELRLERR